MWSRLLTITWYRCIMWQSRSNDGSFEESAGQQDARNGLGLYPYMMWHNVAFCWENRVSFWCLCFCSTRPLLYSLQRIDRQELLWIKLAKWRGCAVMDNNPLCIDFVSVKGLTCRCKMTGQTNQQKYDSSLTLDKDRTVIFRPYKGFPPPFVTSSSTHTLCSSHPLYGPFDAPTPNFLGAFSGRKHYRLYWSLDSFCLGVRRMGLITRHGWSAALRLSGQESGLK